MYKNLRFLCLLTLGFSLGNHASAQELVHYWNFNNSTTLETLLTPNTGAGSVAAIPGGISTIQITSNTLQSFELENLNARNGDETGSHLRFNDPIGGGLLVNLPTTGYENAVLKYVTRRSGSGAGSQIISYTENGVDFTPFTTLNITETPTLMSLDFSEIPGADNNPNFAIKIEFAAGGGSTGGNNRFDNLTLEGEVPAVFVLMHYWNFNLSNTVDELLSVSYTEVGGASITQITGGISSIPFSGNTGQDFDLLNQNARFGDLALSHLRFNDPIGGGLKINIPTSGFEGVVVNYVTRRSSSGAGTQSVEYTTNGTDYTPFTTFAITESPTLRTLDFSGIAEADNNPNFGFRIFFSTGGGSTAGNNRFDNITVEGFSTGGEDTAPPVATLMPLNNSINLGTSAQPAITFNEAVRFAGGAVLTESNIPLAVELRLGDASGEPVAYTGTYADNVITVTPTSSLANGQTYFVVLLANTIEDLSGNQIDTDQTSTFTTIAEQTEFNAGDLVVIAYRMNTTDIDDQFAFLSLVDILPGTLVRFTDAKYTTNPQPQCPGGLLWTAPAQGVAAGTVVVVNNDNGTVSVGTITGSSFGLSSGGDQIIVYTGEAATASHITALSSNAWLGTNISCSGSFSLLPAGLEDGVSSINLSTAPDAVAGLLVNGYYNGPQDLSGDALRTSILNPSNWVGTGAGTPGQTWPNWAFGATPAVVSASVLTQTSIEVIFNRALDPTTATDLANYTGIEDLATAGLTEIEGTPRRVVLTYGTPFAIGVTQTLNVANVTSAEGDPMAAPFQFQFEYNTFLSFDEDFLVVNESDGSVEITLNLQNPSLSGAQLVLKENPWSNTDGGDLSFETTVFSFDGTSPNTVTVSVAIHDDNTEEQDEYFTLYLENTNGLTIEGTPFITIFITDNDRQAPQATKEIELNFLTSYAPDSGGTSTVEVVAYSASAKRVYATSAVEQRLDIIDFSNPASPSTIQSVDISPYGGITSVSAFGNYVAVASPNANEQLDGSVVFFDLDGNFIAQITTGALPDMITFSPDGNLVLTANEGQPSQNYSVDPEGSVTVINVSGGVANVTQANALTLDFTAFNAIETDLIASGVRKTQVNSTLSQDLEPEYVTVSEDSQKAWVVLQENNAIAEIDLVTNEITMLQALGSKDYNAFGNGMDASDRSGAVLRSNWPIKGFYIPDAIGNYEVNGVQYILTANEGDEKEYDGLEERTEVADEILDSIAFPHAAMLQQDHNIGRFRMTNLNGDEDGDGIFEEIYGVGARSFSIFRADNMELVYDSGDDFEFITQVDSVSGLLFNASNDNNSFKNRSRAKGPEPEGLTHATIKGREYVFVTLERTGGLMVYNITDPANPVFVDYKNTRTVDVLGGDLGPESVVYIDPADSPDGKAYALVANEVSGTLSIFEVLNAIPEPCRYFLSNYNEQGGSDIYEVALNEESFSADLNLIASVGQKVSIAYNDNSGLLYAIRQNSSSFQTIDVNSSPASISLPVNIGVNINGYTGAAFGNDGNLYGASAVNNAVYRLDVNNFTGSLYSGVSNLNRGDFAFTAEGEMVLVTDNPSRALLVQPGQANVYLGIAPPRVSGIARRFDGSFLLSSRESNELVAGDIASGDLGIRYTLMLNGTPFTLADGDLASGCTETLSSNLELLVQETPVEANSEVRLRSMPNPTEGNSVVDFSTSTTSRITLEVYDMNGRNISTLFNHVANAGQEYRIDFDGSALPNGVYIYRLTTEIEVVVEKFMIAR